MISRLYFTRVKLGSPAKEFYVQIDTGSDILWVTCASCNGCPTTSGLNVSFLFLDLICNSVITGSKHCYIYIYRCRYITLLEVLFFKKKKILAFFLKIPLEFFDPKNSSTASSITCTDDKCTSAISTGEATCQTGSSGTFCGYSFQYGDGSGTSGYYVSDTIYFSKATGGEQTTNSSATITFG